MFFYVRWNNGNEDIIEAADYADAAFVADYRMTNDETIMAVIIREVA